MKSILAAALQPLVLVFLVSSMAAIGLELKLPQITAPLRNARLVALALLANFILVPMLAIGIARMLRLDEPFAIGLILLGLAAGAPFMPKLAGMANGDVALAVGLMVLQMAGTTLFLPVALPLAVKGLQVNPWEIARFLALIMLLPMAAGLLVKARAAVLAARLRPLLDGLSSATMLLALGILLAIHFQSVLRVIGTGAILAAALFAILAALAGWLLGGKDAAERTVLGLGAGLRNVPAALIVSVQNFRDPQVSVMVIVSTLAGTLVLLPVARALGKITDRGARSVR